MTTEQQTAEAKIIGIWMGDEPQSDLWYSKCAKYHTDWNWFHEAWQKFRALDYQTLLSKKEDMNLFLFKRAEIGMYISKDPTPTAAASLLSQAITWIQSLKR